MALAVGTVLNLINQGDALLGAASFNWLKAILTYAVPYAVCTYGAVSHQLRYTAGAPVNETRQAVQNAKQEPEIPWSS